MDEFNQLLEHIDEFIDIITHRTLFKFIEELEPTLTKHNIKVALMNDHTNFRIMIYRVNLLVAVYSKLGSVNEKDVNVNGLDPLKYITIVQTKTKDRPEPKQHANMFTALKQVPDNLSMRDMFALLEKKIVDDTEAEREKHRIKVKPKLVNITSKDPKVKVRRVVPDVDKRRPEYVERKKHPVLQYSKDGKELIKEWENQYIAATQLKCIASYIVKSCMKGSIYKQFRWKFNREND